MGLPLPFFALIIITYLVIYTVIMGYLYRFLQNNFSDWCLVNNNPFLSSFIGGIVYFALKLFPLLISAEMPIVLHISALVVFVGGVNIALSSKRTESSKKKWLIPLFFPSVVLLIISFFSRLFLS